MRSLYNLGVNRTGGFNWYTGLPPTAYEEQEPIAIFPFQISPDIGGSNGWRCPSLRSSTCNVDDTNEIPSDRSNWAPYGSPVRHCIVEQVPEFCKLQFSFLIAGIVIAANFVKATCMTLLLSLPRYRRRTALVTLEDAISTFLERPDETTRGRCLQSALEIEHYFS